ncbi:catalase family protein [Streptomyces olivochromogenes]|uniref:catalase family protein n=1 Tax=Streptomyces olivochromogenes TaxID=1963 RepID=UPI001F492573|nr:catalase family protein [Streptomyces olivochromogenes]MCF3132407.1 catalase family protein [Streptomyces olivochromogenes]
MNPIRYEDYRPTERSTYQQELDEVVKQVARRTRSSVERQPVGRAIRTAHGKTYGLLKAMVTVGDNTGFYRQGIFGRPAVYDAVVRYSNGLGHHRPDHQLGAACGMGIKLFGVPGPSLLDDERDSGTFDLNLINNEVFFANTAYDYMVIEDLFAELPEALVDPARRKTWMAEFLTRRGTLTDPDSWLWDELLAMLSFTTVPRRNLLSYTYNSMGAFRYGDHIAKIRTVPTAASLSALTHQIVDVRADNEAFRRTLVAEAAERDHSFELQVQLNTDLVRMPVDNTSVKWPEDLSPWVTVARVDLPRQDVGGNDNLAAADTTSITPWRSREEHRPIGEIQRVRQEVYRRSSIERHRMNGQDRREPAGSAELLG